MKDKNQQNLAKNKTYKITHQGSLGLLAVGDVGLRAWREVKNSKNQSQQKEQQK